MLEHTVDWEMVFVQNFICFIGNENLLLKVYFTKEKRNK